MELPVVSLLVVVIVGAFAAWKLDHAGLAPGFGPLGDMLIGIAGAFGAVWTLAASTSAAGNPIATLATAVVGAVALLWTARKIRPRAPGPDVPMRRPATPAKRG